MKHLICFIAGSLLLSSSMAQAAGGFLGTNVPPPARVSFNNGMKLYAGASLGHASQSDACNNPFFEGDCDDGSLSWKAFAGTRVNPMFGAEIAYASYGEASEEGKVGQEIVFRENELSGLQINAVGYLPIAAMPQVEVIGKAGAMLWERDTQASVGDEPRDSKDDGIAPMLSLGAQYQLDPSIHLRAEWEHVFNAGADSAHETDVDNYSLSLIYSTL